MMRGDEPGEGERSAGPREGDHLGPWRRLSRGMEWLTVQVTSWAGSAPAFLVAVTVVIVWALLGPLCGFSDTWQLVINTGTTIVTFLMVFLLQRAQNKESLALQLKLNEIVAALKGASNRLINIEDLSEDEVRLLHQRYQQLAELARQDRKFTRSHSVEECEDDATDARPSRTRVPPGPG